MARARKKAAKKARVTRAFRELKKNPPAVVKRTRKKKGAAAARKQVVAIALRKAGVAKKRKRK